ncbi:drug/metabolite exporter YedA [Stenotrophomonas sp. 169]|uniref:drug/metabolite exporter YedA n=1 Tax=unclassified Stenotrophomonas TaxID=196198 RepID=UPI001662362A|nr:MULTISPECIES: drug/metabolite exporter YedA [unclassified Stenotrophomonas]MBD8637192.1 drug/metabolite exporter YedA [Stenotrophomonas sp. CFBP 13725]MBD8698143.1 drug/metabolite exporter YedA [Stenotrophomonas sp. CFBP 13718]QNR97602.1 drug/metabolite exporter YedA [Stenotrophomonas sp. 169]
MAVVPESPAAPRGGAVALALLLVYVVWGSTYLGIAKALQAGVLPLTSVSGARFIVAGSLMYAALRLFWKVPRPTLPQWRNLAIMGFTMLLLGNGMVVLAERDVSSGLAATAVASVPLWMALFSAVRGQHATRGEWLGIAIGFLGVVWLNAGSSLAASPTGLVLLLVAPVGWAFGSVWVRGQNLPTPFMTAAGQMICGGVLLVITGLAVGERPTSLPTREGLLAVAYLCVFGSIIAFTAYVWLLHNVRPALAGSYAYVNPVIAVLLGVLLNGEHFGWRDLVAMAVILVGVVVLMLARARK